MNSLPTSNKKKMQNKPLIKIHALSEEPNEHHKEVGQLSVDIYNKPQRLIIVAPIAGLKQEEIHIALTEDVLTIKGERRAPELVDEKSYHVRECFFGPFSRSIVLPKESELDQISAEFENNILIIHIPQKEREQIKVIKISSDNEN